MSLQESDIVPYHTSPVPAGASVLVFAPHPDDEVYGCGGAVALHALAGQRVCVVVLTAGEQQVTATADRLAESRAAAAVLGVTELVCWGVADRKVQFSEQLVERVMQSIELAQAQVVYAPSLWEAHPDHRNCAMAVLEAVRRLGGLRQLRLYEISAPLRPHQLVDISPVWHKKQTAMACFSSQEALMPYAELMGALNRYRALTVLPASHVEAYECFVAQDLSRPQALPIETERARLGHRGVPSSTADFPLVSVVVRTMGRDSLARALASVAAQTYPRLEVVLVDAAGHGQLPQVPVGMRTMVRRAGLGRRLGRAEAANAGLDAALGDWLLLLDDDDWLYPDHIAKLVSVVTRVGDVMAAHTPVECVDETGTPTGQVFDVPYAPRELCFGNFLPIHSVLFSRRLLDAGCRFDPAFDLYEDWDFWLQVDARTAFAFVPGVSAAYYTALASGAGVRAEPEKSQKATEAIFAKWGVVRSEHVFQELIRRALVNRQLQGLLNTRHALIQAKDEELAKLADLAHREQTAANLAQRDAEQARMDAHVLRAAHDAACADRDAAIQRAANGESARNLSLQDLGKALGERDEARHAIGNAYALVDQFRSQHQALNLELRQAREHYASELAVARQETGDVRSELSRLINELAAVNVALSGSRDEAFKLYGQMMARQADIEAIRETRSWRVTRPLRFAGKVARVVKRMGFSRALLRGAEVVRSEGLQSVVDRIEQPGQPPASVAAPAGKTYADWVQAYDTLTDDLRTELLALDKRLTFRPLVSIVMPVYNPVAADVEQAIASVKAQLYENWELCMCDDASPAPHVQPLLEAAQAADPRIRVFRRATNGHIAKATNDAIGMANGAYLAFLDHDDMLAPHALLRVVEALNKTPDVRLFYSDEDKLNAQGERFDPYFKPDFNLGLLRSHNYMCHFAVYEAGLLKSLSGIRQGFDGAQDYDLALRAVDAVPSEQIVHLPHVLYHWRVTPGSTAGGHHEKSYAFQAGQRALTEHLARRKLKGEILEAPEAPGMYRVRWTDPVPEPLVSIVIPTRNGVNLLTMCLDTLKRTRYSACEVIVVDNGSDEPATLSFLADRVARGEIHVLRDDSAFNFSSLNNRAVREMARGDLVLLMNNDIEITDPDWLHEMVGHAMEPGVGCVGARLWYPDGRLQHGGVIMVCGVAGHSHKYLPKGQHGYMGRAVLAQDFLGVTAACLMIRRSVYDEVGGLDETLKVAFNDVDFCLRVHKAGYRNVWTPYAELVHHESVSRGHEDTPEKQQRFSGEVAILQERWPDLIAHDPCYSPNLTSQSEDFSMAWPPRRAIP